MRPLRLGNTPFPNSSAPNRPFSYRFQSTIISSTITVYGRDYEEEGYDSLQREAGEMVKEEASRVMAEGRREEVVDASCWWKGRGRGAI